MFRQISRFTSPKRLANVTRWNTSRRSTNYMKVSDKKIKNWYFSISGGVFGLAHVYAQSNSENKGDFSDDIKRATCEGEKYLAQMMRLLRTLILQTSIDYQENLIKQIEITKENTKIGPLGEHWDRLTKFRIKGNELKDELYKYEALATSICDIVNLEIEASLEIGNNIVLELLNGELEKLQKLCEEQLEEVRRYETELLSANRDSILHGVKLK